MGLTHATLAPPTPGPQHDALIMSKYGVSQLIANLPAYSAQAGKELTHLMQVNEGLWAQRAVAES